MGKFLPGKSNNFKKLTKKVDISGKFPGKSNFFCKIA